MNRIPIEKKDIYRQFYLTEFPFDNRDYSVRNEANTMAQKKRKDETSAVTPLLPSIRSQCHFRWNQIRRLRELTNNIIEKTKNEKIPLPFSFDYEESDYLNEKLYFELNKNLAGEYYLVFIKSENLSDGSPGEGLWFFDLLRKRLLGAWSHGASELRKHEGSKFLEEWGHDIKENIHPFQSRNKGVLTQGFTITRTQNDLDSSDSRLLINIEPIYIACMFATFAIDIQSFSGARMNEILQISYDKQCCVITEDKSLKPSKKNYIFRLIPKGRDVEENYYMPESIYMAMASIIKELKVHYAEDSLPTVKYSVNSRAHIMEDERKYIFQYERQHINHFTLNSVIRFLTHGLIIQTEEGKQVILKTHLLRHAFATHMAQTEKLPLDLIKQLLHQKDINVTSYYSAPTQSQITNTIDILQENWVSYIDIQQGLIRSPSEILDTYNDYKEKVGTVSKVIGGVCTIDSVCPTKMACMGCVAKAPQPEFKKEIEDYYQWAYESEIRFNKQGLEIEAKKMKIAMKRAKIELKEIEGIEQYKKDEAYAPKVQFKKES
ncbi:hypothetical protein [Paenibacillus wynnii]|uniref:hypothetical protein n=1 Tax=Paenibacillus wynnii TaxID=268407 RepID=UPI0027D7F3AF|nr:hypothetical protein [Paenibacillus wynnii]